jgi:protein SCO1/2
MKSLLSAALLSCLPTLLLAGPAGQPAVDVQGPPEVAREVGIDQKLDSQVPLDLEFRDESGRTIHLDDCFGGKPVVLVLAYYRCPKLCNIVLNSVLTSFREMKFTVGQEFNVVTVSFDPRETPELAAAKKKSYLDRYGRDGAEAGWHFLTGDKPQIDALANAVGFRYRYVEKEDLYAHASGIMVLTPQGRVSRYFYGNSFSPRDLRLGLVEASENKIGSPADQILLLCLHYDSRSGTYVTVMSWMRAAGALTVVGLLGFIVWSWRRNRRRATAVGNALRGVPVAERNATEGVPYSA